MYIEALSRSPLSLFGVRNLNPRGFEGFLGLTSPNEDLGPNEQLPGKHCVVVHFNGRGVRDSFA